MLLFPSPPEPPRRGFRKEVINRSYYLLNTSAVNGAGRRLDNPSVGQEEFGREFRKILSREIDPPGRGGLQENGEEMKERPIKIIKRGEKIRLSKG